MLAGRLGAFRLAARLLVPDRAPRAVAAAAVPGFTALLSALVNLADGLTLHGGTAVQLAVGAAIAAAVSNLPTAALHPAGVPGLWAAILATTIGPNLIITGSVATVISRRITRDAGAAFKAWQFSAAGSVLLPAQLAVAMLGLHITGALGLAPGPVSGPTRPAHHVGALLVGLGAAEHVASWLLPAC